MGLVYGYPMPESKRDSPVGRGKPPVHAVDVGRAIAHHPIAVAAQVSDADIVAQMTRMFGLSALDLDLAISISCRWSAASATPLLSSPVKPRKPGPVRSRTVALARRPNV